MSETIRDVVLRIRAEVSQTKVPAPDLKPFETAAQKVSAVYKTMGSDVDAAAQRGVKAVTGSVAQQIRSLRELVGMMEKESAARKELERQITSGIMAREREAAQTRRSAEAAQRFAAISRQERYAAATRNSFSNRIDEALAIQAADDKQAAAQQRAAARAKRQNLAEMETQGAAGRTATGAFRSLGESTMLGIRGAALLGADSNGGAQKILDTLLTVQGGLDIYKAGTGGASALMRGFSGLRAASGAASSMRVPASFLFSAPGAAAGVAAFGGGIAAGYGLNKAMGWSHDEDEDRTSGGWINTLTGGLFGERATVTQLGRKSRALRDANLQDAREVDLFNGTQAFRSGAAINSTLSGLRGAIGGRARTEQLGGVQLADQERNLAFLGMDQQNQVNAARARYAQVNAAGAAGKIGGQELKAAQQAATEQEANSQKAILETMGKQVELAQRKLDLTKSMFSSLGALNTGEQDEVKRLLGVLKGGGQLNEFEEQFLQGKAGGNVDDILKRRQAERGSQAFKGFEDILGGAIDENGNRTGAAPLDMKKALDELTEARKKEAEQLTAFADALKNNEVLVNAIVKLQEAVRANQRQLERVARG